MSCTHSQRSDLGTGVLGPHAERGDHRPVTTDAVDHSEQFAGDRVHAHESAPVATAAEYRSIDILGYSSGSTSTRVAPEDEAQAELWWWPLDTVRRPRPLTYAASIDHPVCDKKI